ncbi:hypothetical protein LTS18_014989 [Coniosporium uncinatum]|uniref:Uncharacterized protein n=1 Tax=Coniosporium uncinatum TaxID=93489 RepID=A0ACC3DGP0_9PEZI|nr:hypothetical protein LTS18_014989 [Coniosporium uncinatum]
MVGLTFAELKEAPLTVNDSIIHTFHTVMKMDGSTQKPYMKSHPYSYTKAFITQTIID